MDATSTPGELRAPDSKATSPRFRAFMAGFPTGVAVVTAVDPREHRPWGMTCSSLCSVAVDPPTLLVGMRVGSPTLDAVLASGAFAVNLLHAAGRPTAELFASGAQDRFRTTAWDRPDGAAGPHLVKDAHSVADCAVARTVRCGGQRIVFGEVVRLTEFGDAPPLLYGRRRFASWPPDAG